MSFAARADSFNVNAGAARGLVNALRGQALSEPPCRTDQSGGGLNA
jgi:hypothetical protein